MYKYMIVIWWNSNFQMDIVTFILTNSFLKTSFYLAFLEQKPHDTEHKPLECGVDIAWQLCYSQKDFRTYLDYAPTCSKNCDILCTSYCIQNNDCNMAAQYTVKCTNSNARIWIYSSILQAAVTFHSTAASHLKHTLHLLLSCSCQQLFWISILSGLNCPSIVIHVKHWLLKMKPRKMKPN